MDIDYSLITSWLKTSVPGIIILGAIGSVIGAITLWLFTKILKHTLSLFSKIIGDRTATLMQSYIKGYLKLRATLFQLSNKGKSESVTALYVNTASTKSTSIILSWLTFIVCYFNFLLFEAEYLKTSIFFVAIFFMFLHDAIIYATYQWLLEHYLYGKENKVSIATYNNEMVTLLEALDLLKEHSVKHKDMDVSQLLNDDDSTKKT